MIKPILLALTFCLSATLAHATIISGTHYLNDGRKADLQGLDWLSTYETIDGTKTSPGGNGVLNDFPGWRYAASWEVERLFSSLGSDLASDTDERWVAGAAWYIKTFGNVDYGANGLYTRFFFGADDEIAEALGGKTPDPFGDAFCALLYVFYATPATKVPVSASFHLSLNNAQYKTIQAKSILTSHMLVRGPLTSPVPEPSTIILFSVGLCCVFSYKRKISI